MIWNQKYGMMTGYDRHMMGNYGYGNQNTQTRISPEQAVTAAPTYLDTNVGVAGLTVNEHAEPFYGYYTLHVNQNGQTAGMLNVNAYTGLAFPHTWHGKLLEMSEE